MLTLSVAFLLFIFIALPPLKLWLLVAIGIVQSPGEIFIATYGGGFNLLEHGVPLAVFFTVLGRKSTRAQIKLQPSTLWVLRILSAAVLVSWLLVQVQTPIAAKALALTAFVAVLLSSIFIIYAFVTSFGAKPVALSLIGTVILMSTPLVTQIVQKANRDNVWREWCTTTGDHFNYPPEGVTRVQFRGMGELPVFEGINGDQYEADFRENVGKALSRRGYLVEYEDDNPSRLKDALVLIRQGANTNEPISVSSASHLVTLHFLSELKEKSQYRYQGLVFSVIDVAKQKTIAKRTLIYDMSGKRVCGPILNDKIDTSDFIIQALALEPASKGVTANETIQHSANPAYMDSPQKQET